MRIFQGGEGTIICILRDYGFYDIVIKVIYVICGKLKKYVCKIRKRTRYRKVWFYHEKDFGFADRGNAEGF